MTIFVRIRFSHKTSQGTRLSEFKESLDVFPKHNMTKLWLVWHHMLLILIFLLRLCKRLPLINIKIFILINGNGKGDLLNNETFRLVTYSESTILITSPCGQNILDMAPEGVNILVPSTAQCCFYYDCWAKWMSTWEVWGLGSIGVSYIHLIHY